MSSSMVDELLDWYSVHHRILPWRSTRDPYAIWVSEVMLQQTRVATVIEYYQRWMARFPTLESLAASSIDDVLLLWEGLGYYRRAHNLHKAARRVVAHYEGRIPDTSKELLRLPGIGRYTAAAIAAIAFEADEIAIDGNLRRVLARLFDIKVDPQSAEGEQLLLRKVNPMLPQGRASSFNQALMELGAMICRPRAPSCEVCPLVGSCLANKRNVVAERPIRPIRSSIPHYQVTAGVIRQDGAVLIGRRPEGRLLGGLWEFPGGKAKSGESFQDCLARELREELDIEIAMGRKVGTYKHAYTHYRVTVHAYECSLRSGVPVAIEHSELTWAKVGRLAGYPMGKIDRAIAREIMPQTSE